MAQAMTPTVSTGSLTGAQRARFTFSPKVTPFQPSPALTASEYGTGTAAPTPYSLPSDVSASPGGGTPQLDPTARPFVPTGLSLGSRAEDVKPEHSFSVRDMLAMRSGAVKVNLGDLPCVRSDNKGKSWVEQAATNLEKKSESPAMTTLAFLRSGQ
eukprot:Hpha_TRINITY_DN14860_c2_g15::TRINITY_DN14860_c2_g15_i1::g.169472::m.169472